MLRFEAAASRKAGGLDWRLSTHTSWRSPKEYLKAWVDQTKGYWFGGYGYWIVYDGVYENDLGIERGGISSLGSSLSSFAGNVLESPLFQPFRSIGLAFWIMLSIIVYSITTRKKALLLATVPALMVILTLVISTPVYSEFRYAYSLIMIVPVWVFLSMVPRCPLSSV